MTPETNIECRPWYSRAANKIYDPLCRFGLWILVVSNVAWVAYREWIIWTR